MAYLGIESVIRGNSAKCIEAIFKIHFPDAKQVADLTWGQGRFWNWDNSPHVIGLDADTRGGAHIQSEYQHVPLKDQCVDVAAFDPPFIFCVAEDTPILNRDLQWVKAGSLKAGDAIVGFDEYSTRHRNRRFADATVTHCDVVDLPAYEIQLANGQSLVSTGEHPWLVRESAANTSTWVRTDQLEAKRVHWNRKQPLALMQYVPYQYPDMSYQAGLLSGAYDGEGCLTVSQPQTSKQSTHIMFSQNPNAFLDRAHKALDWFGFSYRFNTRICTQTWLRGGLWEILRLLMLVRPYRLLDKWLSIPLDYHTMHGRAIEVISVKPVGSRKIARISSSTGTYIAAGFGAHNTPGISRIVGSKRFFLGGDYIRYADDERVLRPRNADDLHNHTINVFADMRRIATGGCILKGQDLVTGKTPNWWSYRVIRSVHDIWGLLPSDMLIQLSTSPRLKDSRWKNQYHFRRSQAYYLIYKWK